MTTTANTGGVLESGAATDRAGRELGRMTAGKEGAVHTPWLWEACALGDYGDYDGNCRVVLGDDLRVAVVLGSHEESEANARLIAAAPELLDACRLIAENAPRIEKWLYENDPAALTQVRAAIAKATGAGS